MEGNKLLLLSQTASCKMLRSQEKRVLICIKDVKGSDCVCCSNLNVKTHPAVQTSAFWYLQLQKSDNPVWNLFQCCKMFWFLKMNQHRIYSIIVNEIYCSSVNTWGHFCPHEGELEVSSVHPFDRACCEPHLKNKWDNDFQFNLYIRLGVINAL